jgi:FkbM family methyltransferase
MKLFLNKFFRCLEHVFNFFIEKVASRKYFAVIYSQEGEDLLLKRIFNEKKQGFYVDVGAHHPFRFSNTYMFYKNGWKGINIEPNPDSFENFIKYRPKDINLNYGVANHEMRIKYFMFDEPALNTFDKKILENRLSSTTYKHIKTVNVDVKPLAQIFEKFLPNNCTVDFLSVDVEGLDMEVIKSNDWQKYRPNIVIVEQLGIENIESLDFEIHAYMRSIKYVLFAKTFNTLFYKDNRNS